MRYWLVMPAAGVGRRFGEQRPKQYALLQGRTVIEWALAPFVADTRCAGVVVALANGDPHWPDVAERLRELAAVGGAAQPATGSAQRDNPDPRVSSHGLIIAQGGGQRSDSVRNGLALLSGIARADDWVLVHDAARPCLPTRDLDLLLERLERHPVGGLLAAPAADTLKRATAAQEVEQTVDRAGLWRALTPQMFRYSRLCEALDAASAEGRFPTDESQALEWLGERPVLVEGSAANIKITTPDDLLLAQALLGARQRSPESGGG